MAPNLSRAVANRLPLWNIPRATNRRRPLIEVLWSYYTTPHLTIQETPFCLTFGTNAMILVNVEELSSCAVFTQCDGRKRNDAYSKICNKGQSFQKVQFHGIPSHFIEERLGLEKDPQGSSYELTDPQLGGTI
ncbi:hypothetical protein CR513_16236, partial [Mucuna pruriens]